MWGDKVEFLEEIAATNTFTPQALEKAPPYYEWMHPYMEGFFMLSSCRTYGMGANPLSMSDILAYIQIYNPYNPLQFIRYIKRMDNAYLDAQSKKQEQERGK
jgi:hypothetical protein